MEQKARMAVMNGTTPGKVQKGAAASREGRDKSRFIFK